MVKEVMKMKKEQIIIMLLKPALLKLEKLKP